MITGSRVSLCSLSNGAASIVVLVPLPSTLSFRSLQPEFTIICDLTSVRYALCSLRHANLSAFLCPLLKLFVQLQYISAGRYLKAKKGFIQFYIELMVGKLDSIFIAIGVVSNYPDDGKRILGNG